MSAIRYDRMSMQLKTEQATHGSDTVTDGIRITVVPSYLKAHSDPAANKFVFAYNVTMVNEGETRAKLKSRHWEIVDADGERHEVRGPGVVGQTPELAPGDRF